MAWLEERQCLVTGGDLGTLRCFHVSHFLQVMIFFLRLIFLRRLNFFLSHFFCAPSSPLPT